MKKDIKILVQAKYSEILKLVEEGWTISDAISKFKIDRGRFYNNITDIQKQELIFAKSLHASYGRGFNFGDLTRKQKIN